MEQDPFKFVNHGGPSSHHKETVYSVPNYRRVGVKNLDMEIKRLEAEGYTVKERTTPPEVIKMGYRQASLISPDGTIVMLQEEIVQTDRIHGQDS